MAKTLSIPVPVPKHLAPTGMTAKSQRRALLMEMAKKVDRSVVDSSGRWRLGAQPAGGRAWDSCEICPTRTEGILSSSRASPPISAATPTDDQESKRPTTTRSPAKKRAPVTNKHGHQARHREITPHLLNHKWVRGAEGKGYGSISLFAMATFLY